MKRVALALVMIAGLAACQTMADVRPGDGRRATIENRSYEDIWKAALKVADEHFDIKEQDQTRGVIVAERTMTAWSYGAWVGIYVTPPTTGAKSYTVEVVRRKKMTTNVGEQDWEKKVLRDIEDVLAGRPLR